MTDEVTQDVNQEGTTESSAEAPKNNTVPVENRVAELNRKFSGLTSKIDQLIESLQANSNQNVGAERPDARAESVKGYDDVSRLRDEILTDKHRDSFKRAVEAFPELDKDSESYDEGFWKETDALYRQLSATRDPEAPIKAAKFVALERGKFAQLERQKVLADESRRTRIMSEGGIAPKSASKPKETVPSNLQTLATLLGADQAKLKEHVSKNKKRYGLGE